MVIGSNLKAFVSRDISRTLRFVSAYDETVMRKVAARSGLDAALPGQAAARLSDHLLRQLGFGILGRNTILQDLAVLSVGAPGIELMLAGGIEIGALMGGDVRCRGHAGGGGKHQRRRLEGVSFHSPILSRTGCGENGRRCKSNLRLIPPRKDPSVPGDAGGEDIAAVADRADGGIARIIQ